MKSVWVYVGGLVVAVIVYNLIRGTYQQVAVIKPTV